ncbi:hypothetical protein ACHWQZ_G017600 [Mnemiopsis leidyi]
MDFGRRLRESPSHNNLKLNTNDGGEVWASSVILSFNSHVIDHMTTTLHMTSVDMLEFSEAAVQMFVDSAYSGTAEGINREIFRDINKMANIFEVAWLVSKCSEYFTGLVNSVTSGSYTELFFLFEEAGFVYENLKMKDFLNTSVKKIESLKWKQQFLDKYLENAERFSTKKLDTVIELAGSDVNIVVQTLVNQLSEMFRIQGPSLPVYCKYLLDNSELHLCQKANNRDLFNELFDILKELPSSESKWTLGLYRKCTEKTLSGYDNTTEVTSFTGKGSGLEFGARMAPRVKVPMDFGRQLRESPSHNNLKLNTNEGKEVLASSVILSFNSPVIDHMTTTLHMTSVDMLEFSEAAVQMFVDSAYSGTAEGINREIFRDMNKMANVFEVAWLVSKCSDYFTELTNSVTSGSYAELFFLFEEAAFVHENLKMKDFLNTTVKKIESLKWKKQFLDKYLENAERFSTKKLDTVIELAGSDVDIVVQTLVNQLSEMFRIQGPSLPVYCKYLLDNSELHICQENNGALFNELFDVLRELPNEQLRWTLDLHRQSTAKMLKPEQDARVYCGTRGYVTLITKLMSDLAVVI